MDTRPVGVTVVGIIIVIAGILGIVVGVLGFIGGETLGWGILALILSIVIGVIYLLVAKGIFNGNATSRLIVGIVTVIGLISGIFSLFGNLGSGIVQILWSVVILALLYTGRAKEFFNA
jgi:drug/metabolite transporter (DMT)-like permease